ncbi:MAG: hydroxymethylbilane synthase, partial [Lachnospiraceae bacterium]|nr:hydroxymethylbilane synthase [Lachnospiraceae bacterium]
LALQGRIGEDYTFLQGFCSEESRITSVCERAFIRELDGGCSSPIAAHAVVQGDTVVLRGLYYEECSGKTVKEVQEAPVSQAENLGIALARRLKQSAAI